MRFVALFAALASSYVANAQFTKPCDVAKNASEVREFVGAYGSSIQVNTLGDLVGLKHPKRTSDIAAGSIQTGFAVAYTIGTVTRVAYHTLACDSDGIVQGRPDLVPSFFDAPTQVTPFKTGQNVVISATMKTRDGVLEVVREYIWFAGTGSVIAVVKVKNVSPTPVVFKSYKIYVDPDPPKFESDLRPLKESMLYKPYGLTLRFCPGGLGGEIDCPTPPNDPPTPSVIFSGALVEVTETGTDAGLGVVGPITANRLTSSRTGKDLRSTLVFTGGTTLKSGLDRTWVGTISQQ